MKNIIKITLEAGERILEFYDDPIAVETKKDDSPLTKADLASHNVIVNSLKELTPEIPIISEEGGLPGFEERKNWEKYWLVDPLDGTKEFIKKNGEFTVNIALIEKNVPVLGVVHIPAKQVTYVGEKKSGSFKIDSEGKKKQQIYSQPPDRSRPLTVCASRSHGASDLEERLADYGVKIGKKISAGSSLKFCLVAEGTADVYPRFGPTMEWDTAAGDAVYRYSGRSGERNSPIRYNKPSMKNEGFILGLK